MVVRSDVLRPEVCLHAEDMRLLPGCQIGHRVERIDFVDGHAAPDPEGFGIGVGRLVVVEIKCELGVMITSWPSFAALMPPALPRHDMTMASDGACPSSISSQPMMRRPRSARYFPMRSVTYPCR